MFKRHFKEMLSSWKAALLLYIIIVLTSLITGLSIDMAATIVFGSIMLFIVIWGIYITIKSRRLK